MGKTHVSKEPNLAENRQAHSETNIEIAFATRRDSRIMKSISSVTLIFLSGTFFAVRYSDLSRHAHADVFTDSLFHDVFRLV